MAKTHCVITCGGTRLYVVMSADHGLRLKLPGDYTDVTDHMPESVRLRAALKYEEWLHNRVKETTMSADPRDQQSLHKHIAQVVEAVRSVNPDVTPKDVTFAISLFLEGLDTNGLLRRVIDSVDAYHHKEPQS